MDLLLYCGVLLVLGFMRVGSTANVSDDVGVADAAVVEPCDLPVGGNLMLNREPHAYTLILMELGLMK